MMRLKRTCKEATALLIAREDLALSRADQLALRLHLLICKACPKFARQMLTLRNSMKEWRNYTTSDEL
jgi:hypothetical protein